MMMESDTAFEALLSGRMRDPDTGEAVRLPVKAVVVASSLARRAAPLMEGLGAGGRLALVSDAPAYHALGARVREELGSRVSRAMVFDAPPKAEESVALALAEHVAEADALVAVGSGTINDLTKYAAFRSGKPYAVFPSAPSMNGYLSATASLVREGHKQSLPAAPPVGVFCDLDVLRGAPMRLIRSGLGDSICRPTAQADWLLSRHVLGTPYRRLPFALLERHEPALFAQAPALAAREEGAVRALMTVLLLSGAGMTLCGGSHPASQGEHMLAHAMDALCPGDAYHGEQIAVTTLTVAALQEQALRAPPHLADDAPQARMREVFGGLAEEYLQASAAKLAALRGCDREALTHGWPRIADEIRRVHLPAEALRRILLAAGCPTAPEAIGWDPSRYAEALPLARLTRDRFTFLDMARQ